VTLVQEILYDRAYISGEFLHDYIFYLCNAHTFISCVAAHPRHPYTKLERSFLCLVICLLIVFPVTILHCVMEDGPLSVCVVFILVTVPRFVIKMYMRSILIQNAEDEALHRDVAVVRRHHIWEGMVFAFVGVLTLLICVLSYMALVSRGLRPFAEMSNNTDALFYAFILEPLFDLLRPIQLQTQKGRPLVFGWVGAWMRERDEGFVMQLEIADGAAAPLKELKSYNTASLKHV